MLTRMKARSIIYQARSCLGRTVKVTIWEAYSLPPEGLELKAAIKDLFAKSSFLCPKLSQHEA